MDTPSFLKVCNNNVGKMCGKEEGETGKRGEGEQEGREVILSSLTIWFFLTDQSSNPDMNVPSNWRRGTNPNGSPGAVDPNPPVTTGVVTTGVAAPATTGAASTTARLATTGRAAPVTTGVPAPVTTGAVVGAGTTGEAAPAPTV